MFQVSSIGLRSFSFPSSHLFLHLPKAAQYSQLSLYVSFVMNYFAGLSAQVNYITVGSGGGGAVFVSLSL